MEGCVFPVLFQCDPCHMYPPVTYYYSVALSPQANYTDWATATCSRNLVPTFVDRGVLRCQRGGSPTVVNLNFLDRPETCITNQEVGSECLSFSIYKYQLHHLFFKSSFSATDSPWFLRLYIWLAPSISIKIFSSKDKGMTLLWNNLPDYMSHPRRQ
jgi:hypothetical protein